MGGWLSYILPSTEIKHPTTIDLTRNRKRTQIIPIRPLSYDIFERPPTYLDTVYESEEVDVEQEAKPLIEEVDKRIYFKKDFEQISFVSKMNYFPKPKQSSTPITIPRRIKKR